MAPASPIRGALDEYDACVTDLEGPNGRSDMLGSVGTDVVDGEEYSGNVASVVVRESNGMSEDLVSSPARSGSVGCDFKDEPSLASCRARNAFSFFKAFATLI